MYISKTYYDVLNFLPKNLYKVNVCLLLLVIYLKIIFLYHSLFDFYMKLISYLRLGQC